MDGLIALCHFCELHGPCVIFCTQSLRSLPSNYFPANEVCPTDSSRPCPACTACTHTKGLLSKDSNVFYLSGRSPHGTHVEGLVRKACVRSLSCEVCPGGEGAIYFGDCVRGHALSFTFSLKDVYARGLKRWFSILVLVKEKSYLLTSWIFLELNLRRMVEQLQARAAQVFASEGGPSGLFDARRQRVISSRGLPDLIDFKDIWRRLHTANVWLMMACGERVIEVMGCPCLIEDTNSNTGRKEDVSNEADQPWNSNRSEYTRLRIENYLNQASSGVAPIVGFSPRELFKLLGDDFTVVLQHLVLGFHLDIRAVDEDAADAAPMIALAVRNLVPDFLYPMISVKIGKTPRNSLHMKETVVSVIDAAKGISADEEKFKLLSSVEENSGDRSSLSYDDSASEIDASELLCRKLPSQNPTVAGSLHSTPSLEVYDALKIDTLMVCVSVLNPNNGVEDCFKHSGVLPTFSSQQILPFCRVELEDMSGQLLNVPPRLCTFVRAVAAACGNTALRDDTLELSLQHLLQQWLNKVKLWSELLKQQRLKLSQQVQKKSRSRDSSTSRTETASQQVEPFHFGSMLPPFLTNIIQKSADRIEGVVSSKSIDSSFKTLYPDLRTTNFGEETCTTHRTGTNQQWGNNHAFRTRKDTRLYPVMPLDDSAREGTSSGLSNEETQFGSVQTPPLTTSLSSLTAGVGPLTNLGSQFDLAKSLGVEEGSLQKMLLAVNAVEADVAVLQCWASHSKHAL